MARSPANLDVFHAIADHRRRQMLDDLMEGERSVGEIAQAVGLSYSATSQHLTVLLDTGLVARRTAGKQRIYRIESRELQPVFDWVSRYERFWRDGLNRLHDHIRENPE